jgi:hypothetical protein
MKGVLILHKTIFHNTIFGKCAAPRYPQRITHPPHLHLLALPLPQSNKIEQSNAPHFNTEHRVQFQIHQKQCAEIRATLSPTRSSDLQTNNIKGSSDAPNSRPKAAHFPAFPKALIRSEPGVDTLARRLFLESARAAPPRNTPLRSTRLFFQFHISSFLTYIYFISNDWIQVIPLSEGNSIILNRFKLD